MGSAGVVSTLDLYGVAGVPVALAVGCVGTVLLVYVINIHQEQWMAITHLGGSTTSS